MKQGQAYVATLQGYTPPSRPLDHSFKFGRTILKCMHASPASISLHNATSLHFEVAVIDPSVPFLLHLDVLWKYGVTLDSGTGHMTGKDDTWQVIFHYGSDHSFFDPARHRSTHWSKA